MWQCNVCERFFKSNNQSHICHKGDIDEIFGDKPEELLLAFDKLLVNIIDWEGCTVGATQKAIIFTKRQAWLIVRPMSKELDIKFYAPDRIEHHLIRKIVSFGRKYGHHIRISNESQVSDELLRLLYDNYRQS
jgi:hypothetical protein